MTVEVEALRDFLSKQPEAPRLHINGPDYITAMLSVDFGQPLGGIYLSADRGNELTSLMRSAAKSITRRRGAIRVNFDNNHGVFFASLTV